jgi:hypothetical protein
VAATACPGRHETPGTQFRTGGPASKHAARAQRDGGTSLEKANGQYALRAVLASGLNMFASQTR